MILFLKNYILKAKNYPSSRAKLTTGHSKLNRGMTYVELIVVLGIFAVVSSVAIFDYGTFQHNIDIRVLANDIAIKVVEAQKSAINGKWHSDARLGTWKPSYGVYFNVANNMSFTYYADLDNDDYFCNGSCSGANESIEQFSITKGNYISSIGVEGSGCPSKVDDLNITFTRPEPIASLLSATPLNCTITNIQINVSSSDGSVRSLIRIFPSGRIQIQ